MKTKLKRALFGMMAGIMVANTPLTVLADYQPMSEYKNEQKTDSIESDTMRGGHEKPLLERENLYQYLTELKEEDRAKLLTELSEEEIYELVILLQYEYVNTFSQEQSLELYKEVVDDYWKSMPELKTDKEKKEYVSKLSKWHEKAFEYVDTKEKTEESYLEALYKDKIYAKEMLNLFAEYLDKSEEDSVSEDAELKEMRKAKEEALEEAYKELKDSVFPVENQDSSEDTTEIPKEDKPEVTPEIPSEEVKPDASDETTVETERQPDSTGNAETPEQSSEEVTTPEDTPEETPEEVDLSLSKKELKKLMKSKTFSIEKFSKRMYESRNFYPIYATFKSSKKESFLGSRTETELYQIMLMSKYTLLQQYLKYASTGVDKTDMADLGMYLSDYQMILKQWIITSTAEGTHLTQEEKDVLNVDILNILKESDHLEVTDFAGYEEYLKNLESKIDVSVLLEAFGKIDLTSDDTLSNSIGELASTSYKLFQMEEEMNGSAVEATPAMEKRNRVMAVAERASNGQEVSVAEGMYYFTAYTSNMAMQVEGNGTANMTNVCLRPTTNTANNRCEQKWIIIKRSDGWYKILSNYSRKSLDLYGGSSENYQNIDLYEDNNSDSQCWKFYYCDGRYVVKSKIGTVLDVPNANFTSGTNIQSHEQNNSNAQQWTLSKVTDDTVYLKPGNSSNGHGYTASAPVNNMHDAYERLQYSGGTIMLMDQWDTTTTITLTGTSYTNSVAKSVNLVNGCTLGFKRYSGFTSAKSMFSAGSGSLTLKNLTFDGNSGNVKKVRAIIYSEIALNIDHCNFQNSDTNNSAAFIIATKNLTATNCTFKSSHSTRTDQNNTIGGVWLNNDTVGTFTDCNFSENRENSMVLVYYSKGIFKRCNFTNNGVNKSSGYGSAIGSNAGDVELYNCTFEKNYSIYDGGAIHINNNVQQSHDDNRAHFYAEGCTFTNNSSGRNSGAIMLYDTGQTATIKNCKFNKNSASNFAGAIGSYESTDLTLTGNTFSGNSATEGGGAVYNGAKLTLTPNGSTADSFKSNTAQKGGAICHNGTFFKMVGGSTIDTGNDVFLSTGKYITVPSALSSSFAARVTPEEYESGRVVVRNTYGVKGSTIKSKFTLTPSGGFYLLGGDMYTGANSADVVLAKGFTITYNANGGTGAPAAQSKGTGESVKISSTKPTRSGYTFKNWNTLSDGNGITYNPGDTYSENADLNLYAQWTSSESSGEGSTATKYTLTYNPNGGSVYPTSKQLAAGEKYGTLPIPKREGYTFDGWYTSPYSYFATKVSADTVMGSFNVTIYAHWTENVKTYTVKYNGNGNTGGSTASSTHTVGVAKNLTANGFTRTGYAFAGWNTSANGNGTSYADKESVKDLSTTNGATVTLYAKWTPREYQLTMNPNGGAFADGNTHAKTLSPNLIYDGTNWHNVSSNTVSRTGYTFDGWYDKATGGEKVYNIDGSCISGTYWKNNTYKYTGNLTVYAHWTAKKYTVTYNSNGGSGSMATDTVTYGTAYRTKANQFTKTGYTFVGWNEKADGTGSDWTSWIGKDWTWTYTKNVTLYAQWRVNSYTLNITGDSGVEKITGNGSYNYGVTANVTYKIKTGYHITSTSGTTVDGNPDGSWTDKAGAEGTVNDSWEIKTCDRTIVVHTAPNTYTVKYNGNGNNEGSTANSTHTYDVAKNLTKNGFVKTGYTFKGWNTKADGSGTSYADKASVKNLSSTNGATITLYAQWTANKYTVAYNANGGIGTMATDTVSYGTGYVTKTNAFTRTGYTFKGWNEKADGTGTDWTNWIGKSWTWTYTKNITLYAQWTANQYQLTLNPNNGSFSDGTTVAKTLNPDLIYNGYNWCDISSQKVSRTGYTFDGWYDKASGGEKVYDVNGSCVTGTYWKNNIYQHTGNLTVYAHWAPKSVVVTFHRNASSSDTVTAQQTFTYDKSGQKFTDKGWTKKGYTLLGWSDSKDAATATYPITCGVSNEWINGRYPKTDLYAVWKANTYTIKYNGNGNDGGSTASSTHTVDLAKNLTVNGFTKTGYTFIGWNTKADGTGTPYKDQQSVKNLAYENGATVTLYAQWSANKYIVVFNANGGTGKMEDQEMIYDKATALRANTFTRVGYRFDGWNTRADGTGTTYADKATVKNLAEKAESRVILYAGWHSAPPELEAKDATYYEGQEITKKDLLKNVTKAFDAEDGDVTGKVKIVKIEYAAGKLVDGKEQPGYVSEWKDGMPDGEKLDTWFMQLPKEKAPVTHKITYQVTDLSGKTTTKTSSILVKYNEFPVITGVDRYFTLADAKAGKITEDVLLKDAIKSGKLKSDDKEEGVISNKITILDYKDTDFKNVNGNATVTVVFKVTDSMGPGGVGKETIYEIKVKIIDPESNYWRDDDESASRKKVRFITKKYYDKNKDLDYRDMSSEAIEASSDNGGLNVMSKWYQNADYKALLTGTFEKETGTEYKIDSEKAKKLKEKIETDGIGNSKRDNALTDIYNSLK